MMTIRATTRMGIQAAIAIFLAELISLTLHMERGYWTTLTAMALTAQTWGESVKRSFERVTMTIFGGVVGTALYFSLPSDPATIAAILLLFVFFTIYFFPIFHLAGVFTLTCFVVFLFAMLGNWTILLLEERVFDTILGAAIALLVNCFFLPDKSDAQDLFITHLERSKAALSLTFFKKTSVVEPVTSHVLSVEFQTIRKKALSSRYELLFHRLNNRNFNLLMKQATFCTQYIITLINTYRWLEVYLSEEDKTHIRQAAEVTVHNLDVMIKQLKKETDLSMLPATNVTGLLTEAINQDSVRFASLDNQVLGFFNLMYYFTRLNTRLNEIFVLFGKMK
ncbi:FUSC family protein [Legionella spiritensis]|uniref:Fusaric acid resistance protein family protein n=1 Tax=Legionella spiritensis TaxID=452 RepID=A0A0W0Z5N1_LEGSP|nr:FUSC family protein [Legionella spiritensis]KTD64418.1 Fusaric acid resistance protein family protein [Legionella spiritensis]SNV45987.1 Predicted membrane protein [Legionella spiritensis]